IFVLRGGGKAGFAAVRGLNDKPPKSYFHNAICERLYLSPEWATPNKNNAKKPQIPSVKRGLAVSGYIRLAH
ncbi:hypothetical protein, partial [Paenibacillus koleovorans]|uniref:hypothetical protein n=1 Tax=Paenibacillus koleovorans TaxID=121608 RepID=UPI001C3FCD73